MAYIYELQTTGIQIHNPANFFRREKYIYSASRINLSGVKLFDAMHNINRLHSPANKIMTKPLKSRSKYTTISRRNQENVVWQEKIE